MSVPGLIGSQCAALPAAVEVAIYRIVDEALTNVVKHANARAVRFAMRMHDGSWRTSVYYSILESEWPGVKRGLLMRLGR